MKTKTLGLLALPVIAAIMIGGAVAPAFAGNNAAVVEILPDGFCGVLDGNGNIVQIQGSQSVVNNGGNTKMTCKGTVDPADNGRAVQFDFDDFNITCGTPSGSTDNWKNTVSASGKVTLTCFIKGNQ